MSQLQQRGKVMIVGAGPGDPDLLTIKAVRALQEAEVVITDRLVGEAILTNCVPKNVLILHAGKQRFKGGSTPQYIINELLVDYALQGKKVVRLKGGDVSVFSNLLDELEALNKYDIPYEIVPGITAACGAAAYAGIPLTARNYANAIRFLTLYKINLFNENYWQDLATTEDSLVFYMSAENSNELVEKLLNHGISEDKHIAIIEQATTPLQHVISCPIHEYPNRFQQRQYISPAVIIVGKVAGLYDAFHWKENSDSLESYFKPIQQKQAVDARA